MVAASVAGPRSEGTDGVDQLGSETLGGGDVAHQDGQRRGRALLPGVPEGGAGQVGGGQVEVGLGHDHERVLPRRLGHQRRARGEAGEELRRLEGPGEDDAPQAGMANEGGAHRPVGTADAEERVSRDAGGAAGRRGGEGDGRGLGCGLEDDGVSRGQGGQRAADRDGQGEVPGADHGHGAQWPRRGSVEPGQPPCALA